MKKEKYIIINTPLSQSISYYEKLWRKNMDIKIEQVNANNDKFQKLYMLQVDRSAIHSK